MIFSAIAFLGAHRIDADYCSLDVQQGQQCRDCCDLIALIINFLLTQNQLVTAPIQRFTKCKAPNP